MSPLWLLIGLLLSVFSLIMLRYTVKRFIAHRASHSQIVERDPLLASLTLGKPALIYFTTPGCGPCRLTQQPIIQQLQQERGETLQVLTINIEQKLDDAMRWGVMKVPRTFVLDHNVRPYVSNLNIATLNTLRQQIDEAERSANLPAQPLRVV